MFPADTVYGLACDPGSADAVARLYALKGRPPDKPAAVMFFALELALAALPELGPRTRRALERLLPGRRDAAAAEPARGASRSPAGRTRRRWGCACRACRCSRACARPVLQTSANLAGGADARRLDDVPEPIRAGADLVLDGGELPGTPSTVVDLRALRGRAAHGPSSRTGLVGARGGWYGARPMTELQPDYFERPLADVDPEVAEAIGRELERQQRTLEMIASENFVPEAVLECQGSVLTNKYAEGYPGKRYYGGCEHVDVIEQLAIDRAKALFGAEHANVQPHAGAQANASVYHALLQPGDTIMGLALPHGGHLSHGMKINVSGRLYDIAPYEVSPETHLIDMDEVARIARERRPKLLLAGWSAYPRVLDFPRFREIADEVGAFLMVDMAHFAGLVAAGLHPNPVPYADVVTSTVHKTLGGARGGLILCREEYRKKIDSAVFPGQQGGPLEHVIAGKAVAFKIAASAAFRERQERTVAGAQAVAGELLGAGSGVNVLTGGTDVHIVLVDLRDSELDGMQAEDRLHEIGITVNRNAVPFDPRPPAVSSGLRIGTSALATRGVQADDFTEIGRIIATALQPGFDDAKAELAERAIAIADRYPLYAHLRAPAALT